MSLLVRLALLAYPRSFRRDYGAEWTRTIADMRTYGQQSALRVGATVLAEAFTTALHLRWENLMKSIQTVLTVIAATIAAAALVLGSEAILIAVVAVVVLIGLQLAGKDRLTTPSEDTISGRWYLWLAGAAGAFLVGLGALAIDGDDDLTTTTWATWMLSWTLAAVLALIGIALGATRLFVHHR